MALAISSARPSFGLHPHHSRAAAQLRALARDLVDLEVATAAARGLGALDLQIVQLLASSRSITRAELAVATRRSASEIDKRLGDLRCRPGEYSSPAAQRWRRNPAALVSWRTYGEAPVPAYAPETEPMEPWITPLGRRKLDEISAAVDEALLPLLRQLPPAELERMTELVIALRDAAWEVGAAPVVEVLEPEIAD